MLTSSATPSPDERPIAHGGPHLATRHLTVAEAFLSQVARGGTYPAILDEQLGVALTWRGYGKAAQNVSAGLKAAGLGRGDAVGLLLSNRPEFHIADIAVLLAGSTPISLYHTAAPEQLAEILDNAGCSFIITEPAYEDKLEAALALMNSAAPRIVVVGRDSWMMLLTNPSAQPTLAAISMPEQSDTATVIYTSGTTGAPKGVELTHRNIMTTITEITRRIPLRRDMRSISFLPMAHIAERLSTHYIPLITGSTIVCCGDMAHLVPLLQQVQPEILFSPPRLWEKLMAATAPAYQKGADPDTLRRNIGCSRVEVALTGAAPCSPRVLDYFRTLGVPLRETYGMSESAGVVSIAELDAAGCVGKPLPHNEVRVDADGELLVRGPSVMARYRRRPSATSAVIDEQGWLRTGDIARVDNNGRIWIVDRKKDLIINSGGKNMSPANIEARLREADPLIEHACVIGDGRPYNIALIVVDDAVRQALGLDSEDSLRAAVQEHVDQANSRLSRVERVRRFAVVPSSWTPDSDELTPTFKLKRTSIQKKYADVIEALYADDSPVSVIP
ncbi:AMP-dependent synthetase/ligase [Mycolicibacterium parafortuitum]|uniref:Long-chain acyl-CoA synthetases (AMP-forming) [Gordonia sp. KTR9] n=1 Tax=Mycolicibacterium parafortuitum TaxID=39692 RepID=A0A375YDN1_MYCPF|nr:AMP-dependent synthetase/ligase [Mycolicibacterium parafortuitum]SRX79227.1 Long-chain acyl-CoA synthetases (AMP-forming) [Gordonia sp. KTR9] [Mycolicibacterium parafortuitum]